MTSGNDVQGDPQIASACVRRRCRHLTFPSAEPLALIPFLDTEPVSVNSDLSRDGLHGLCYGAKMTDSVILMVLSWPTTV